ncbi:MAG: hypothetical protein U5L96_06290 [Owenweeksia sp.]|nr:hypothetical protein [Owenweeksia sp.]
MGADAGRKTFYLKVKGQMEDALRKMAIPGLFVFRPSLLMGDRSENRFGEKIAAGFMKIFGWAMPKRYRGIEAKSVAEAMLRMAQVTGKTRVIESDEIARLAQSKEEG